MPTWKKIYYVAVTAASAVVIVQMALEIRRSDGYEEGFRDGVEYGWDRCFDGQDKFPTDRAL